MQQRKAKPHVYTANHLTDNMSQAFAFYFVAFQDKRKENTQFDVKRSFLSLHINKNYGVLYFIHEDYYLK